MALIIQGADIGYVWERLLVELLEHGKVVSPREMPTREIQNVTLVIEEGTYNIILSEKRDLNYKFMVAEWLWIMAAQDSVQMIAQYNSQMNRFSDDGQILNGAYGPRLMPQLPYIIKTLKNQDTRQAVATIWTPNPSTSKDIPCTISLQWLIRFGQLHCTINMRSSDAWLGIPYDFFNFSQVSNYLSYLLKIPLASITMNLASSHLYLKDEAKAFEVIGETIDYLRSPAFDETLESDYPDLVAMLIDPSRFFTETTISEEIWIYYAHILASPRTSALTLLTDLSLKSGGLSL